MSREQDFFNKCVGEIECRYLDRLWEQVSDAQDVGDDDVCDMILDQISIERERLNPANSRSIDQEEIFRATGIYTSGKIDQSPQDIS